MEKLKGSKKYLVTGGSGKLGRHIIVNIENISPSRKKMDIMSITDLENYFKNLKFDAVLHLAAISDIKEADRNRLSSYQTNVIGTRNVADFCKRYKKKCVYISTDYVFRCDEGNYSEKAMPYPANWYGFTKYCGELEVQSCLADYLIIRCSFRPIKWGFPAAFTNVYTTADYVDIIAAEIILALKMDIKGIIHIGTPTKTFHELAIRRNKNVKPEECTDNLFPKKRNLNIEKWMTLKSRYNL